MLSDSASLTVWRIALVFVFHILGARVCVGSIDIHAFRKRELDCLADRSCFRKRTAEETILFFISQCLARKQRQLMLAKMLNASRSPGKGVQYFQHFPKNFLRPYGQAADAPNAEVIFRRLAPFNCEWLTRPNVALSELANTLTSNMEVLMDSSVMLNVETVLRAKAGMDSLLASLSRFDTKANQHQRAPNGRDLDEVVERFLDEKFELDRFFDDAIKIGGALFTMGIHFKVADSLLNNPEQYGQLSRNCDGADSAFKKECSLEAMMRYLQSTCLRQQEADAGTRRNLLEDLRRMRDRQGGDRVAHIPEPVPLPQASSQEPEDTDGDDARAARRRARRIKKAKRSCQENDL